MSLDLVGDVVQARALLREEPAHRRVRAERREQLDVVLADVQQHGLDALLLDDLAVGDLELEAVAVELERGSISSTATPMWSMRLNISRSL